MITTNYSCRIIPNIYLSFEDSSQAERNAYAPVVRMEFSGYASGRNPQRQAAAIAWNLLPPLRPSIL